jgi:hypothetical protein
MDFWVKVGIIAIIMHLLVGFGWLAFKLLPRKKSGDDKNEIK